MCYTCKNYKTNDHLMIIKQTTRNTCSVWKQSFLLILSCTISLLFIWGSQTFFAYPQNFWSDENPRKICGNLGKICENVRKIAIRALILQKKWYPKNGIQNESADVFFRGQSCFLFLFGQVRGNLGKNGVWSVLWFENAPNMKGNAVVF